MPVSTIILQGGQTDKSALDNCLNCLHWVDEVIIVSDHPALISTSHSPQVLVVNSRSTSFADRRNQGAKKASHNWLLYVDTDERVTPQLAAEIQTAIADPFISAYRLNRQNYFLGQKMTRAGGWPDSVTRLIRRDKLVAWSGNLHEQPEIKGKIATLKHPLIHLTHRDLESMTRKTLAWSKLEAQNRLKINHPPMSTWRFFRIVFSAFWDSFVKRQSAREGTAGTVEGLFQVYSQFMTYGRLWELQQKPSLNARYQAVENKIKKQWQANN